MEEGKIVIPTPADRVFELSEAYSVEDLKDMLRKSEVKSMLLMLFILMFIFSVGTLICLLIMLLNIKPLWLDLVFGAVLTLTILFVGRALTAKINALSENQADVLLAIYVKKAGITRDANEIAEKYQEP